jgi:hypothetical protein
MEGSENRVGQAPPGTRTPVPSGLFKHPWNGFHRICRLRKTWFLAHQRLRKSNVGAGVYEIVRRSLETPPLFSDSAEPRFI